jgi:hypothetical protein
VSFDAITLCVASQLVFIFVSVYFVIESVRKLFIHLRISCKKVNRTETKDGIKE